MNLSNWKLILGGGGAIVLLLMLCNHYENTQIRTEEGEKWKEAIANAKATVIRDTIRIPIPQIVGTAKSKPLNDNKWSNFVSSVHSNNDQTPEKCDSLLQYCNYILQPFNVVADTAGVSLSMTANPRYQTIDYALVLPPKEVERISTTNEVIAPTIDKNWLFGLSLEYKEREPGIGAMLGIKPITIGATYFKDSPILWRVGVQWEF